MAKKYNEKAREWVLDGVQNGISGSPHAGIADMKCVNINSFPGEAAVNFARISALPVVVNGTMTASGGNNTLDYTPSGTNKALVNGSCVQLVAGSTITNFTNTTGGGPNSNRFWVKSAVGGGAYQFSLTYNGPIITNFGLTGTATFSTVVFNKFIQGTDEFVQSTNTYRYYLVDSTAQVWVNDPNVYGVFSPAGIPAVSGTTNCQGFGITQGTVNVFVENTMWARFTNRIGDDNFGWNGYGFYLNTPAGSMASHRALRSQVANGALFWPDSQFIGSVMGANSQFSLLKCSTPGGGDDITVVNTEQGVLPALTTPEIITAAYAPQGGTSPSELPLATPLYITETAPNGLTFRLSLSSGGSPINPISAGNFYITTFDPSTALTFVSHRQALALPYDEQATALAEISIGNTVNLSVGGIGRSVYFWNETDSGYTTIVLPEGGQGTQAILNVANATFIFAGNKGNIYLTNATGAVGTLTLPDYVANPNGGNQDPYLIWGTQPAVMRGRVFFGIQDQTASHTGNAGGVFSFTPPQNAPLEANLEGSGLHLENENSYGTYNGLTNIILPNRNQQANGPQFYTGWTSDAISPAYGIDTSGTTPYANGQAYIDWDIVPIGDFLDKGTPINFEYKLSRPLVAGESVQLLARGSLSGTFALVGIGQLGSFGITTSVGALSDVFAANMQNFQWIQCRTVLTSTATTPSYVPITELIIRV